MQFDPRLMAHIAQHLLGCIDHPDPFHGSEIDTAPIVNFFGSEDSAPDDVVNVSPVSYLFSGTPDDEGILPNKRSSDHRNHCVVLNAAGPINSEITATYRPHAPIPVVSTQGHLGHQFRPAVHIVSVVRWADPILRKI